MSPSVRGRRRFAATRWLGLLAIVGLCATGCSSVVSNYSRLDNNKTYPPRPVDHAIEVFESGLPSQAFVRIARLDVHIEKTSFVGSGLPEVMPKLKELARQSGGDAIIEINESKGSVSIETRIYHVTATAIRYTSSE